MQVTQIPIRQRVSRWNLIKFQILAWCSLRNIILTNADIDMLVLLALLGKVKLTQFCEELTKTEYSWGVRIKKCKGLDKEYKYIFDTCQSARNASSKVEELGLIKREGRNKSNIKVWINPEMDIHIEPNLLINYQILSVATD